MSTDPPLIRALADQMQMEGMERERLLDLLCLADNIIETFVPVTHRDKRYFVDACKAIRAATSDDYGTRKRRALAALAAQQGG